MKNSKNFCEGTFSRGDFVEFKDAIENYKNFKNIQDEFRLGLVGFGTFLDLFYNVNTKTFFLEPNKFDKNCICLYKTSSGMKPIDKKCFVDLEYFKDFLSQQLMFLVLDETATRFDLLKNNVISFDTAAKDNNASENSDDNILKKYFIYLLEGDISEYHFTPRNTIPLRKTNVLFLEGEVFNIYISAQIDFLNKIKKNKDFDSKNKYKTEIYRLFLLSGLKSDQLNKETKILLNNFFKGKYNKILDLDYLLFTFKIEVFPSVFAMEFIENGGDSSIIFQDEYWMKKYYSSRNISLKDNFKYVFYILGSKKLNKFELVKFFIK